MQIDTKKDAAHHAEHHAAKEAFEAGLPPTKNPYEYGASQWVAWASHYGTLAHAEPDRLPTPTKRGRKC